MDRIQAITDALAIIERARVETVNRVPAAWTFLMNVTRYLESEQRAEFSAIFTEGIEGEKA